MRSRYKITGFGRFIIFMMFFLPLVLLATYMYKGYSGQDIKTRIGSTLETIKIKIKGNETLSTEDALRQQILKKDEEMQQLREQLFRCEQARN